MNKLLLFLIKIDSYFYKSWYMLSELCLARFGSERKLKILFSRREAREKKIKFAFRFLQHTVTFGEINPETIAAHDLVVPLNIEDIVYLNQVPHLIKNNPIPIPNSEAVRICDDKYVFAEKMIANNFRAYIPQINGDLSYPFFFKKKTDVGGQHSYFVENYEQELALLNSVNSDEYFRQKFVSGTKEYATHILFAKHQIVRSVTIMHTFEKDSSISAKEDQIVSKMVNCPYLDLFASILNSIDFEGICCFDYKVVDNHPCIFEINPRFGGSFALYFFSFLRSLN
jgi:hypothetical protein